MQSAERNFLAAGTLLLIFLCASQPTLGGQFGKNVVAADHPAASEAGAEILRRGGNVVDAAVATSFALSVTRPASCGIGGGGFMVIWDSKTQQAVALDYRERAPSGIAPGHFQQEVPSEEPLSVRGGLAVGIPGTVSGLCYAAEKYGTLPIAELVEPALGLCRSGVEVDEHDMEVQASALARIASCKGYEERFSLLRKLYLNDGVPWKKGDRFYSPQLRTLEAIAAKGAAGFYEGPVAEAIAATTTEQHGRLTLKDLLLYSPTERKVLAADFHDAQIITMPPPSSGGVALIQSLQTLEAWEARTGMSLKSLGHNSGQYVHIVTEALKHAFADRAEFLGDTDFVDVPVDRLLDRDYCRRIAERIQAESTLPAEKYGRFFLADDSGTSHFSVMDSEGNAVACTETINLTFGSFVVVPDYGILLNNQMDDFTANPGRPNAFGLIQSVANAVEPGKRPLSSMTPTIVVENGRAVYACGASGGPRIITATLQSLLNSVVFDMQAAEAVQAPRFHHQWSPNDLLLEPALEGPLSATLKEKGHSTKRSSSLAASQAASLHAGQLYGGSDPRKHGRPAGE